MIDWHPIETAPKTAGIYLYGYDRVTAHVMGDPAAGLCLISWSEPDDEDDDVDAGWIVQPLAEGLDIVVDHALTHWAPIPTNIPPGATQ